MIVVSPWLCRRLSWVVPIAGITFWPFILLAQEPDPITVNHERIHLRQQTELLLIGFYVIYVVEWLVRWAKGLSGSTSYALSKFEKEAYAHETELNYLATRKRFAWKEQR